MASSDDRPRTRPRYRKISTRIWGDEKVMNLTPLPPSGVGLWLHLLLSPDSWAIPGLLRIGKAGLAEELGWPVAAVERHFAELESQGMAVADWRARLVWLPKAIAHNDPENPNVVLGWVTQWDELPECDLKRRAWQALAEWMAGRGASFAQAFARACPNPAGGPPRPVTYPPALPEAKDVNGKGLPKGFREPFGDGYPKGSPNQEQEQEQEQEHTQTRVRVRDPLGRAPDQAPAPRPSSTPERVRWQDCLDALQAASGGRFVWHEPLVSGGSAGKLVRVVRAVAGGVAAWTLIGEWLAVGGAGWGGKAGDPFGVAWLQSDSFGTAVAAAQAWDAGGRKRIASGAGPPSAAPGYHEKARERTQAELDALAAESLRLAGRAAAK